MPSAVVQSDSWSGAAGVLTHDEETLPRACCLCGPERQRLFPHEPIDGYRLVECACGMVLMAEEPPRNDNERFLEDAKLGQAAYWGFPHIYVKYKAVFDGFFEERLSRLRQEVSLKTLLDIGCGYGLFQRYCHERGIETVGIDLSQEGCASARRLGLKVFRANCNQMHLHRTFDAIVMCDILEHSRDPERLLLNCRSWLKDGGAIYIQVPNVLGDTLPTEKIFNLPYHLWQFSPVTLQSLLRKCGYVVRDYWTGVMGVIGEHEKGGPDQETLALWEQARREKRGNRLQMLAVSPERLAP